LSIVSIVNIMNKQKIIITVCCVVVCVIILSIVLGVLLTQTDDCNIASAITVTSITDETGNNKNSKFVSTYYRLSEDAIPAFGQSWVENETIQYVWQKEDESNYYIVCSNDQSLGNIIRLCSLTNHAANSDRFNDSCIVSNPVAYTGEWKNENSGDRIIEWEASYD